MFSLFVVHFYLSWRVWTKSLRHLYQNSLVICCTLLDTCLQYKSGLWKTPGGGITTLDLIVKFFGDKDLNPWPSLVFYTVSGRELITTSVSVMSICKDSSSNLWPFVCNNDSSIPLAEQMWRSHIPPMWLAACGFLFHFIKSALLFWRKLSILVWPIALNVSINSCTAPTRFVLLSKRICLTFPLLGISPLTAWMKESVVILCETSMCALWPACKTQKHCIIAFYFASFDFYVERSKCVNFFF